MNRLSLVDLSTAQGTAKTLLDAVQANFGFTPNMFRMLAQSPAALEAVLNYNRALGKGALRPKIREQIALVVAESNGCDYCASAHSVLGKKVGLSDADIADAREGHASDPKSDAAVRFAALLVKNCGHVSDTDFARLRGAGFSDGEIAEIVGHVAINILTSYFNNAMETEIDFPVVRTHGAPVA
jgi:uncharacterized peroxidase-related enzyme